MKISKETVRLIKDTINIVDVIAEYVRSLKRSGKNWIGLCPFHSDKNPSFSVSEEYGIYKCFSCGESGDVIKFIEKIEHITFVEAVSLLAKRAGVQIDADDDPVSSKRDELVAFNARVAKLFHYFLVERQEGGKALEYLFARGIERDFIDRFSLGYAPGEFGRLEKLLASKGFKREFLAESGLFSFGGKGMKTLFFDRLMFPIYNYRGECVGFGGRVLNNEIKPKYLNTPETVVYKKSQTLYGIQIAKEEMKKSGRAFLVEGYVDVIACHKNGITNAVAPCGTAVTKEQIKLLTRFVSEIVLLLDGDSAGVKGAVRALKEGANIENVKFSVIILPNGMDPDDYFSEYSVKTFNELVEARADAFDFCVDYVTRGVDLRDYNKMVEVLHFLFDYVSVWNSDIIRELFIKKISALLHINLESLLKEYEKFRAGTLRKSSNYTGKEQNVVYDKAENTGYSVVEGALKRELDLLLYLHSYDGSEVLARECGLDVRFFSEICTQELYMHGVENHFSKSLFVDRIENGVVLNYVMERLLSSEFEVDEMVMKNCIVDLVTDLLKRYWKQKNDEITESIKHSEMYKDYDLVGELQKQKEEITGEILKLHGLQELKK